MFVKLDSTLSAVYAEVLLSLFNHLIKQFVVAAPYLKIEDPFRTQKSALNSCEENVLFTTSEKPITCGESECETHVEIAFSLNW